MMSEGTWGDDSKSTDDQKSDKPASTPTTKPTITPPENNDDEHEDRDRDSRRTQVRSKQIIDDITKPEQRANNALKPPDIDWDSIDNLDDE
jgi:hypothetical protein